MSPPNRAPVACIGAGRLARTLLPAIAAAGYPIVSIAARRIATARALRRQLPDARACSSPLEAVAGARLVLLAVPDAAIAPLAAELAGGSTGWAGRVVLHHAGALGADVLRPLSRSGAAVGVLHPLQVLGSDSRLAATLLPGSRARLEGDPAAVRIARRLARELGMVPLRLPARLQRRDRVAYHAAASMLSNDLLALLSIGVELLERSGVSRIEATRALAALAGGTLQQASRGGIGNALTGPAVRGDVETLEAHLSRLSRGPAGAAELHRALSRRLLLIADREGRGPLGRSRGRLRKLLGSGGSGPRNRRTV